MEIIVEDFSWWVIIILCLVLSIFYIIMKWLTGEKWDDFHEPSLRNFFLHQPNRFRQAAISFKNRIRKFYVAHHTAIIILTIVSLFFLIMTTSTHY